MIIAFKVPDRLAQVVASAQRYAPMALMFLQAKLPGIRWLGADDRDELVHLAVKAVTWFGAAPIAAWPEMAETTWAAAVTYFRGLEIASAAPPSDGQPTLHD